MDLLTEDLDTTLDQKVKATANTFISAIRPHIFINNTPPGSLEIIVLDEAATITIATSNAVAISSIGTLAFIHGLVRFDVAFGAVKDTTYTIRLSGVSGYVFSGTDFVGWNRDFDLRVYDPISSLTDTDNVKAPFKLELWGPVDSLKGV